MRVFLCVRSLFTDVVLCDLSIVVPAKSDSDIMFVYKVIRDVESIYHYRFA